MDLSAFFRLERVFFTWTQFDFHSPIRPIHFPSQRLIQVHLQSNSTVYQDKDWRHLADLLVMMRGIPQLSFEEISFLDVLSLTSALLAETLTGFIHLPVLRLNNCGALSNISYCLSPNLHVDLLAVEGCWRLNMSELQQLMDRGIVSRVDVFESGFQLGDLCQVAHVVRAGSTNNEVWVDGQIVQIRTENPLIVDVTLTPIVALWNAGIDTGVVLTEIPRLRLRSRRT